MRKNTLLGFWALLLTLAACQNNTQTNQTITKEPCTFQVQDSLWIITVNNGKGSDAKLSDIKSPSEKLDSYIELVCQVDPELDYSVKYDSMFARQICSDSLKIDTIGNWEDYDVYYISNEFVMLRSVLLKDCTGRMRILYTESDHVGSPYSGTKIYDEKSDEAMSSADLHKLFTPSLVSESGKIKLVLKYFVGGNKEYINEFIWKINPNTHIPKRN
jgi:hypothetical protein